MKNRHIQWTALLAAAFAIAIAVVTADDRIEQPPIDIDATLELAETRLGAYEARITDVVARDRRDFSKALEASARDLVRARYSIALGESDEAAGELVEAIACLDLAKKLLPADTGGSTDAPVVHASGPQTPSETPEPKDFARTGGGR